MPLEKLEGRKQKAESTRSSFHLLTSVFGSFILCPEYGLLNPH